MPRGSRGKDKRCGERFCRADAERRSARCGGWKNRLLLNMADRKECRCGLCRQKEDRMSEKQIDLLLKGGHVIDPAIGIDEKKDIAEIEKR